MKIKLTLAALALAGALSGAHAKNATTDTGPVAVPSGAATAIGPALDSFLTAGLPLPTPPYMSVSFSPGAADYARNGGEAHFLVVGDLRHDFSPNGVAFRESPPAGANVPPPGHGWKSLGDHPPGFDHAAVSPIPEPETYALMLAGLACLAFVGKRRMDGSRSGTSGNPGQA